MEKYLSISQAAKILDVSPETLRRWDNSGKFKSSRHPINNYRVYSEEQIVDLVEEMQLEIQYRNSPQAKKIIQPFFETDYGKLYNYDAIQYLKQ
ncbi:MAG: helix-turn-helix domain-containing protein [Bacteroidota bacterium]